MSTRCLAAAVCLAVCLSVGCASLATGTKTEVPAVALGTYSVQTTGAVLGNQVKNYPLREGMTVQDVLQDSGQLSRHRNFEIDVLRKSNTEGSVIKMPVQFDVAKHRVKYETDYAIFPGDRILIRPVAYSPFEQMAQMVGPTQK